MTKVVKAKILNIRLFQGGQPGRLSQGINAESLLSWDNQGTINKTFRALTSNFSGKEM
ncbi:MAG: hypothetical protein K2P93_09345 [Alphaproteobacteria bacterium]|nr:hypothetical protein [Alphaproteobacteria bacterium]